MMAGQITLFRAHGSRPFSGTLLGSVTRDPAMLIWLDNRYNAKAHPNENYAREVMELFALGPRQLHRRRRQGSGARVHRLDARQGRSRRSFNPGAPR